MRNLLRFCCLPSSFKLVVVPDRVAQLSIHAKDLTDFIARTAREPVLVSFIGGSAKRSVVENERGLKTERPIPLFSSLGTKSRVEALRELERFRRLRVSKVQELQSQSQYDVGNPKLI